jgi:hypothetical protein
MVCAKRIECSETSGVSEIRRILDSMIWFQRDCDEETRRLSSQVTRYAFTSDDRRSATGMLNLCRRSECIRPSRALAPPPDGIRFSRTGSTRFNAWFILSSRCSSNYDPDIATRLDGMQQARRYHSQHFDKGSSPLFASSILPILRTSCLSSVTLTFIRRQGMNPGIWDILPNRQRRSSH